MKFWYLTWKKKYKIIPNKKKDLLKCPKGMFVRKCKYKNDIEAMEN
jgi:hypothetical protein